MMIQEGCGWLSARAVATRPATHITMATGGNHGVGVEKSLASVAATTAKIRPHQPANRPRPAAAFLIPRSPLRCRSLLPIKKYNSSAPTEQSYFAHERTECQRVCHRLAPAERGGFEPPVPGRSCSMTVLSGVPWATLLCYGQKRKDREDFEPILGGPMTGKRVLSFVGLVVTFAVAYGFQRLVTHMRTQVGVTASGTLAKSTLWVESIALVVLAATLLLLAWYVLSRVSKRPVGRRGVHCRGAGPDLRGGHRMVAGEDLALRQSDESRRLQLLWALRSRLCGRHRDRMSRGSEAPQEMRSPAGTMA